MKYILVLFALIISLTSCETVIDLELDGRDSPLVVIEANVINKEYLSFVKLSESINFYTPKAPPALSGANVSVSDDLGNIEIFLEDSLGTYLPQDPEFKGQIGQTYHLKVEVNGQTYTAHSELLPVANIDSLTSYEVIDEPFKDDGFYVGFYAKEPQDTDNWYLWKAAVNGVYFSDFEDLMFADDQFVGADINNLELPFTFALGDTVLFEQHSITEEVYQYYSQLQDIYFSDGGLFSPPPVNPITNIEGGAVGIFITSAMDSKEIIVK